MGSWLFTCAKSSQGPAAGCDIGMSLLASWFGDLVMAHVEPARCVSGAQAATLPAVGASGTVLSFTASARRKLQEA
jgi:hypothetical protein